MTKLCYCFANDDGKILVDDGKILIYDEKVQGLWGA